MLVILLFKGQIKKYLIGEGAFDSVYMVKRKNSGTREIIRAMKEISKESLC